MVRKVGDAEALPADPEAEQRKKLKSLAFSRKLLSRAPAKPLTPLGPSKAVLKYQGRDVVKKGQRKNRFLFSFPGLLAPISGGKVGELANLNTRNPVLYLDFPQGRMKLFGTVVYPKNKYLTLQFSRSSKGVLSEDSFENMVIFSEAWWIGRKEDNPDEVRLDFPEECNVGSNSDFDFRGGAGGTIGEKLDSNKQAKELAGHLSPNTELKDEASDNSDMVSEEKLTKMMEETPVRHSARTAGKSLSYAEPSSGDDSSSSAADKYEMVEEVHDKIGGVPNSSKLAKNEDSDLEKSLSHKECEEIKTQSIGKVKKHRMESSEEKSLGKRGALVQATLSTLFDKVAKLESGGGGGESLGATVRLPHCDLEVMGSEPERVFLQNKRKSKSVTGSSPGLKDSIGKRTHNKSKQLSRTVKGKVLDNKKIETGGKKAGAGSIAKAKQSQVQKDDGIEDISSESEELDDSDEDWTS